VHTRNSKAFLLNERGSEIDESFLSPLPGRPDVSDLKSGQELSFSKHLVSIDAFDAEAEVVSFGLSQIGASERLF
jgi:hypothetical protein